MRRCARAALAAAVLTAAAPSVARAQQREWRFDCGARPSDGVSRLTADLDYTAARAYGFLLRPLADSAGVCSGDRPFLFAVELPEGQYDVEVRLGHPHLPAETTVKAESRRLMLESVRSAPGKFVRRSFTVDVHRPVLPGGDSIRLKPRERGSYSWDDRLTLEFNGVRPSVRSIRIRPARRPITLYLAGNSTVVDQAEEPWAAWGQMFPRFFRAGKVVVANYAESGESLRAFAGERRLAKVLGLIRPGDYLFIEFAHNDQKPGPSHVEPFTSYRELLLEWIREARSRGATPVLVTSTQRRNFGPDGMVLNTLGDYPQAMRQTAAEEAVPLIDLTAMSTAFYQALGPEASKRALVHYPAGTYPGQTADLADDTHFNNYGAYELARMVVEGMRATRLPLTRYLTKDAGHFDPAHPDPIADFHLPASPFTSTSKPAGS